MELLSNTKNDIAALVKETPLQMEWEMDIVYDKT